MLNNGPERRIQTAPRQAQRADAGRGMRPPPQMTTFTETVPVDGVDPGTISASPSEFRARSALPPLMTPPRKRPASVTFRV